MSDLVLYTSDDGLTRLDLRIEGRTAWLTQPEIAELFQTTRQNVSLHAKNILEEGEVDTLNRLVVIFLDNAGSASSEDMKAIKELEKDLKRSADIPVREKERGLSSPRHGGLENPPSFPGDGQSPAGERNLIEPTIPDKPTSRLQKYRLTDKGRGVLEQCKKNGG